MYLCLTGRSRKYLFGGVLRTPEVYEDYKGILGTGKNIVVSVRPHACQAKTMGSELPQSE